MASSTTTNDIHAGETDRRVYFRGIKIRWVSLGYVGTVSLVDPKGKPRTLDCETGGSDQSVCSFTTYNNPFPIAGSYSIQLTLTKEGRTLKGHVHKLIVKASLQ